MSEGIKSTVLFSMHRPRQLMEYHNLPSDTTKPVRSTETTALSPRSGNAAHVAGALVLGEFEKECNELKQKVNLEPLLLACKALNKHMKMYSLLCKHLKYLITSNLNLLNLKFYKS